MSQSDSDRPMVSVLIAARNEERIIPRCLAALSDQTYPSSRIEVIVADGCSVDGTVSAISQFAATATFPVQLLSNRKRSSAAGFNLGLAAARGDIIVILGARARPSPDFLERSVAALGRSHADAVGGIVWGCATGLQAETVALALSTPFGVGDARYRYSQKAGDVDTVNYGAYRREVFECVGGFDESMDNVEDDEFNYRLRARGGRLFLSPEIRCDYLVRGSLLALAKQQVRYGYPKGRVLRRHPAQMRPRQFVPATFVLSLLLSAIGAPRSATARLLFGLLLGSYLSASLVASAATSARRGWRFLPLLPVAFAGMHFGYGIASLLGALRFLVWPALVGKQAPLAVPFTAGPGPQLHRDPRVGSPAEAVEG